MVLYKYIAPHRMEDIIERQLIRFTQPALFNDPFELQPVTDRDYNSGKLQEMFDEVFNELNDDIYSGMGGTYKVMRGESSPRDAVESVLQTTREDIFRKSLEEMDKVDDGEDDVPYAVFLENMNSKYGVLSLSAKWDDILMWAHYAGGYSGCVLGFDSDHGYFHQNIPDLNGKSTRIGGVDIVKYVKFRPVIKDPADVEAVLFRKAEVWNYEEEYRMIRPLIGSAVSIREKSSPYSIELFEFPGDLLVEVHMGPRMSEELKVKWKKFFQYSLRYSHVRVYDVSLNKRTFKLKRKTVPFRGDRKAEQ